MFPVRLIYASTVSRQCGPDEVQDILEIARARNKAEDITGLLCFTTDYFLQCLEGKRTSVNNLYGNILGDTRHRDPVLLEYSETSARIFASWSMAYMSPSKLDHELLLKYSDTSEFNPYRLDSDSAYSLILELGKSLKKTDLLE